jgi:hypothetical protein
MRAAQLFPIDRGVARAVAAMTVCQKCGQPSRLEIVAATPGGEFRRCRQCCGLALYRSQFLRGDVRRSCFILIADDVAGEMPWRELATPSWYRAALERS